MVNNWLVGEHDTGSRGYHRTHTHNHYPVPEENRDLAGAQFLRKFRLFAQNHNFFANFALACNFCTNLRPWGAQFARRYLRFPTKVCIFCAGLAYSYQRKIHLAHNTAVCFMQILLIIQRTRLYYGYHTVFLKQNREKLFVATTKHLGATFGQFFAHFQRIFQLNLCATCAQFSRIFAQILHFFPAIFFRDWLSRPWPRRTSVSQLLLTMIISYHNLSHIQT